MDNQTPTMAHESDRCCPKCGGRAIIDWTGEYCPKCLYCFGCEGRGCASCRDDFGDVATED